MNPDSEESNSVDSMQGAKDALSVGEKKSINTEQKFSGLFLRLLGVRDEANGV